MTEDYYPHISPLKTGLAGKCPRCGKGKLFSGYLTVARACSSCGLSFDFADSGDGAAWFVMLFVCVAGVGSILVLEAAYAPPLWLHALIAVPLLVLLPMALLRPVKGLLLCQQWKTGAGEGHLEK